MTGFKDVDQKPITYGCTIEHTSHKERYTVAYPGTDWYFVGHDGPILLPATCKHQGAFKLTDLRASKARVVQ